LEVYNDVAETEDTGDVFDGFVDVEVFKSDCDATVAERLDCILDETRCGTDELDVAVELSAIVSSRHG
jgi:hypothetical protein